MDEGLRDLGEEALAQHPEDMSQAEQWMVGQLLHDQALFQVHVVPLVTEAVRSIIRSINGMRRDQIRRMGEVIISAPPAREQLVIEPRGKRSTGKAPTGEVPPTQRLIRGRTLVATYNWLNYPVGQKVLGDLTRQELLKAATWHFTAGRTQTVNGYFFTSVAEQLKDEQKTVKDILTTTELQNIRDAAERKVA